jgi:uncharacterized membrane protein YeiH
LPVSTQRIVRVADLAGTFVFALEGALTGLAVGLDPVGIVVLAFLTGLGGGILRDLLIGATPPAAIADWHYGAIVLAAAALTWGFHAVVTAIPPDILVPLDAMGLALAAVAGTEKSLDRGINPFVAVFLGTVSGVGGGTMRDIVINLVPRVLRTDIYATAALAAALIVVLGRRLGLHPRGVAIAAGAACITLRLLAYRYHWHLPTLSAAP